MARVFGVTTSVRFPRLDRRWNHWRKVKREDRRLREAIRLGRRPVIVYSHPKTASRSVEQALHELPNVEVFHTHVLRPCHFTTKFEPVTSILAGGMVQHSEPTQWPLHTLLADSSVEYTTISLVRDPVATTVSWLYFGIQRWLRSWRKIDPAMLSDDDWMQVFQSHFPQFGVWSWWDHEFTPVTHIRPHVDGFDSERGWSIYDRGRFKTMILSTHLDDGCKAEALSSVMGLSVPRVGRANQSSERAGRAQYERVQRLIAQDTEFRTALLESSWAELFFTAKQRADFECRWAKVAYADH